ncbi:MAG: hypothetical protein JW797_05660 [Bradymonadales bacterium]|nr:hypothetical protein [Bradymonadales bacterium]
MKARLLLLVVLLLAGCSSSAEQGSEADARPDSVDQPDAGQQDQPVEEPLSDPAADPVGQLDVELDVEVEYDATDLAEEMGPPIELPWDESPHSSMIEWWYYTGTLTTPAEDLYGFELVTFQGISGRIVAYIGHFAVTDLATQSFHLATRIGTEDQRDAAEVGFLLDVDGWTMSGHDGHDQISADLDGYAIDLQLEAVKPAVMQYGDGVMQIGSQEPFYYYSYTRMEVTGTLTLGEEPVEVTGEAWMDHQWGDMGQDYEGWDWYSLRLDDQTEVMVFVVRGNLGQDFVGGTFIRADGSYQELDPEQIGIEVLGQWESPHTGGVYPAGWTLTIPSIDLVATIDPMLDDQEFHHPMMVTPIYWEGLCDVDATRGGEPVGGYAYVELTHYAQ